MSNNTTEVQQTAEAVAVLKTAEGTEQPLVSSTIEPIGATAKKRKKWRYIVLPIGTVLFSAVAYLIYHEMVYSDYQAKFLSKTAANMSYFVREGASPKGDIVFPEYGPFDKRMGYVSMPSFLEVLQENNFSISSQARWTNDLRQIKQWQMYPPYDEKTRAGLVVRDPLGEVVYDARYPKHIFNQFDDVAPLIVTSLLFIENKELLDDTYPHRNPAIEWGRMMRVSLDLALNTLHLQDENLAGASTLGTQIEKFRHSPNGLTMTPMDKLRQVASASLRAYRKGENTVWSRSQIALEYINTVPLAARAGYGEVNGVGDGLWVWYERDPQQVNEILKRKGNLTDAEQRDLALAYKQVLSLFLAQRRPSYYLATKSPSALNQLTNVYLDLMAEEGAITSGLAKLAKTIPLQFGADFSKRAEIPYASQKAVNYTRSRLMSLLGLPSLYELDRLDLSIDTTFDQDLQKKASAVLHSMRTKEGARQAGLYGGFLLNESNDPANIIVSFTLVERTEHANLMRIQADNYDQPFDVNEGVKLDLGSTAKLRTLISYLNIIAAIHEKYAAEPIDRLQKVEISRGDNLSYWGIAYLKSYPNAELSDMLNAAMDRWYSADPKDKFYTGGGLHTFKNFNTKYDYRAVTVREALRHSINLPFIRMMRDVVAYHSNQIVGSSAQILGDINDERRGAYLEKFADKEGRSFLYGFYRKYKGLTPEEIQKKFISRIHLTPSKLSVAYQKVALDPSLEGFKVLLKQELSGYQLSDKNISHIYDKYSPNNFNLADLAYIARIHPLEMWAVTYLMRHPAANSDEILANSAKERQSVYSWLYKTRNKNAQDIRIRQLLEVEAFLEIHKEWQRLGYPFDTLVASYATAIGSSADRPSALAELMGILVNDGVRLPTVRMQKIQLAKDTPYETNLERVAVRKEQVLKPEVAQVVRAALKNVVDEGTAQRLGQPFTDAEGNPVYVGGKTGTGDHRYEVHNAKGQLIRSTVMNRTATFMFYIGDRYFGTITAFVPGKEAGKYRFTSGLPVQLLKAFVPTLEPYMKKSFSNTQDAAKLSMSTELEMGVMSGSVQPTAEGEIAPPVVEKSLSVEDEAEGTLSESVSVEEDQSEISVSE